MKNVVFKIWKSIKLESYSFLILMNLLLAICAFFKDVAFARYFGTSGTADAYSLGFFIPDMIGNNLIAAALGVTCIPIFSRLLVSGQHLLFKRVMGRLCLVIGAMTVLVSLGLYFGSAWILSWFRLSESTFTESLLDYRLMIPIVVLIPMTFIGVAFLQTEKQFTTPAVAPVIYHLLLLGVIVSSYFLKIQAGLGGKLYAVSTTVAAFIYFIIVWVSVVKLWRSKKQGSHAIHSYKIKLYIQALFKDFFPYLLILLFTQSLLFVERYFATSLESGTVAALNYASRLVQFPLWVFVAAITTVLLPHFSRDLSAKKDLSVLRQMRQALVVTMGLSIMMSVGLFVFRSLIVTLLFKRGAFDTHSVRQTVGILTGYSFAIVGQSISLICLRYFIAKRQMVQPLFIFVIGTLCSIIIDSLYVPKIGAAALGYGASIGATLTGLLFLWQVNQEWRRVLRN